MKSSRARMKSSAFASDEIKSASPNPTKSDFIAKRFHPTQVGFLPPSADLVEKSTHCLGRQMCVFFWLQNQGIRFQRRYPLAAPDKQACRSSLGVCEPNPSLRFGSWGQNNWIRSQEKEKPDHKGRFFFLAAEPGFEPRRTESESAVLPLHNSALFERYVLYHIYSSLSRPFFKVIQKKQTEAFHSDLLF